MKTPETRQEVHSFQVEAAAARPAVRPVRGEAEDSAQELADDYGGCGKGGTTRGAGGGRGLALPAWRTREERQQEDRAGERATSACKRAH